MSPRSREIWEQAGEMLRLARHDLGGGFAGGAAHAAYFAMFNAATAALSERDLNAKTHRGAWSLFRETFVVTGEFPAELVAAADRARELRIDFDYRAAKVPQAEAEAAVDAAERFATAVEPLLDKT